MAGTEDSTLLSKLTILRDLNLRSAPNTILLTDRKRLRALGHPAFSISIGLLYTGMKRDYWENGRKSMPDLRMRWHRHLEKVFASMPANTLCTQQVTSYVTQRLAESPRPAPATINRELAILKRMYKLGVKNGALKLSDVPYFPMLRERNVRKGFLKDEQYLDLARETGKIGLWLRVLFECGVSYGWRVSELRGLRVSQVDMTERTISLDPGSTKNEDGRTVLMTRKVYGLIGPLLAGKAPDDKVFTRGRGKTFRPVKSFRKNWARATAAAGCSGLLFHDLRRTGVRNLVRAGVTEKVAMTITGHKTRQVFERYNICSPEDLTRAVALMDSADLRRGFDQKAQTTLPFEDAATVDSAPRKTVASDRPDPLSAHLTPEDRSAIASRAAKARWSREKRPA
jgi:integrase